MERDGDEYNSYGEVVGDHYDVIGLFSSPKKAMKIVWRGYKHSTILNPKIEDTDFILKEYLVDGQYEAVKQEEEEEETEEE